MAQLAPQRLFASEFFLAPHPQFLNLRHAFPDFAHLVYKGLCSRSFTTKILDTCFKVYYVFIEQR